MSTPFLLPPGSTSSKPQLVRVLEASQMLTCLSQPGAGRLVCLLLLLDHEPSWAGSLSHPPRRACTRVLRLKDKFALREGSSPHPPGCTILSCWVSTQGPSLSKQGHKGGGGAHRKASGGGAVKTDALQGDYTSPSTPEPPEGHSQDTTPIPRAITPEQAK